MTDESSSPGSSNGSVVVEHDVVMEANYTSDFRELFENLTKIVKVKIINEIERVSGDSEACRGRPTQNPLTVVGKGWEGSRREVSASPHPSSLLFSGTPEASLDRDPEARPGCLPQTLPCPRQRFPVSGPVVPSPKAPI